MTPPSARSLAPAVLLLAILAALGTPAAGASGTTGQVVLISTGARPMPPTTTALQFTGLASDNATVLFGPLTEASSPAVLLDLVPVSVKILRISYQGFLQSQLSAEVAYPLDRRVPSVPPLASSDKEAPVAYITAAYQWQEFPLQSFLGPRVPPLTYLILQHQFSEPVELATVTLIEPPPFEARVTQTNGYPISNGYTYLVRQDGQSFVSGRYEVTIEAATQSGRHVSYTGTVYVPPLRLFKAGAPMPAFVRTTTGASAPRPPVIEGVQVNPRAPSRSTALPDR